LIDNPIVLSLELTRIVWKIVNSNEGNKTNVIFIPNNNFIDISYINFAILRNIYLKGISSGSLLNSKVN